MADYVAGKELVTLTEVLRNGIGIGEIAEWTQTGQNRVARCLKAMDGSGCKCGEQPKKSPKDPNGSTREWRYYPPEESAN